MFLGRIMAISRLLLQFHLIYLFFFLSPMTFAIPDSEALLEFKKSLNNSMALGSWQPGTRPCDGKKHWVGLICYDNIINGIHLQSMGLSGKIDVAPLTHIPGIRTLSFANNNFSGPLPEFNRLASLKAIFMSENQFSGEIPTDYFAKMTSLKKLWLSHNNLTGVIPSSLLQLSRLIELHLDNNQFSGTIPSDAQPALKSLDLSNNRLQGEIPPSLTKFNASSFAGNSDLCGKALGRVCDQPAKQPSLLPPEKARNSNKMAAALMTVAAVIFTLMVVAIIVLKRKEDKITDYKKENFEGSVEVHVAEPVRKDTDISRKSTSFSLRGSSNRSKGNGAATELVMVNDEKGVFGLPDLMKSAAEVLGNGSLGSSFKATMSNGVTVSVKRMKDMNAIGKDAFDAEMHRLGRLRHWNVLTPLAYHHRKDEKLLIHEYIPKGSLLYILHGDRGPSHADLDWSARLKIIHGIARGLGYLHTELASFDLPHGNLKSSNVLLSEDYEPFLVDYGFNTLLSTAQAASTLFAYKSPEAMQSHHASPKCDVYCLGIIILELLTGKFPSQYLSHGKGGTDVVQWAVSAISEGRETELFDPDIASSRNSAGEIEQLLRIGTACTICDPQQRLGMKEAIQRIEDIHIEGPAKAKTYQVPSLRDGCPEIPVTHSRMTSLQERHNELSGRRAESSKFADQSGHRTGDGFSIA